LSTSHADFQAAFPPPFPVWTFEKNHFAKIVDLVEADRPVAFDALERRSGKTPVIPAEQPLEVRETFRER
jgi:hypothetical protein